MVNTLNKKYKTRNNNRLGIIIGCLLGVCVIGGIVTTVFFPNKNNDETNNEPTASPESTSEVVLSPTISPEQTTGDADSETDGNKKTPTKYEGDDPNASANLTGSITSAEVIDGMLNIYVNIDQYLSDGTCSLTMTSGSLSYTASARLFADVSTSSCEGFSVPVDKLSGATNWNISIDLVSGDKSGVITGETSI